MKKIIKKRKKIYPPFRRFFAIFWSLVSPEKMNRKCFGCEEKE